MGDPVQGVSKDGTAQAPPAVVVGGVDSTGAVRTQLLDTAGRPAGGSAALTASAPTAATVGTSSAAAVSANTARTGLVLCNTSANWISLAVGAAAVLYSGITLAPNGGTWTMDKFTFTTGQIRAIASSASSNLAIQEYS